MSVTVIRYHHHMGRWEPDARGRLTQAAGELYAERGFDDVTVAEIAERAGLTERTFFRHFADKREQLFAGQEILEQAMVGAVAEAPDAAAPLEAVELALHATAAFFENRSTWSQERASIIAANPGLQERELIKMAHLADAIAAALRERGVTEPAASLAAQSGIAVFHVTFQGWVRPENTRSFAELIDESMAALKGVTGS